MQDDKNTQAEEKIFTPETTLNPPKRGAWKIMLPVLLLLIVGGFLAYHYHWDTKTTTAGAVLLGLYSGLVSWLLGIITMVPIVGPFLVKILSIGFIWLLNAVGYVISYIAIRRGYSQDVLTYRGLTIALLVGIVIGYIIAQYI